MVKSRTWIEQELLSDSGLRKQFAHELELCRGTFTAAAYLQGSLACEIESCETNYGSLSQLVAKLLATKCGLWFYAGWIDQAVLHIGKVVAGDMRLFATMLSQIDKDQVDQGGDMMVGFAPADEDWLFLIEICPQDEQFIVTLRSDAEEDIKSVA